MPIDLLSSCCYTRLLPPCQFRLYKRRRRWVFNDSVRDEIFLETLTESIEEFDRWYEFVDFDLRHDKKDKVVFELARRRLQEPMQDNIQTNSAAKPKELVLFAGIGGCSLGDQEAGFDVSWLVEKDQLAASSLKHNHPNAIHYVEDVCMFLDKVEEGRQGYPSKGEVDHLQSSSPCNGFSRANTKGGKHDEENNLLSMQAVRAVNLLKPKTGKAENVTGMLDTRHIHHVINLLQGLTDMDYQIRLAVHNSCHYGVPQKRQRVIITFSRGELTYRENGRSVISFT